MDELDTLLDDVLADLALVKLEITTDPADAPGDCIDDDVIASWRVYESPGCP